MDCYKAEEYFMKFIDDCLTAEEAKKLHKHLSVCEKCRKDFAVYEKIVNEFSQAELLEAPVDFESKVMEQISLLPPPKAAVEKGINRMLVAIGILFITIMSSGFIIFLNRDIIIAWLSEYPALAGYVAFLKPAAEYVSEFTGNIWLSALSLSVVVSDFVNEFEYLILSAAVILLVVQLAFKAKAKDKVEE